MKGITFGIAFVATVVAVLVGVWMFPVLAQAATQNNEVVFGFFLGPFCVILFFSWLGEKLLLSVFKKK
jgi:ABC-type spermidine/putrescine transport system permease subunit II